MIEETLGSDNVGYVQFSAWFLSCTDLIFMIQGLVHPFDHSCQIKGKQTSLLL